MLLTNDPVLKAIDSTVEAIRQRATANWILAFSGGKDSSAALKIFLAAYKKARISLASVTVIYCDTGVENPILEAD
ncbi:hypothetical protein [Tardiphaga sp. vice278]|uniref:hypothetical protein n=1 Tax=Tardiphaga sp. vice278 TaxID=2592815 RepID=UPI0011621ECE|nr:hypothetical protein [Tardiphaga sp. vice278]QDM17444.1 hypothetical protein FNL53_16965 [Tardiphaga sp. vice278]